MRFTVDLLILFSVEVDERALIDGRLLHHLAVYNAIRTEASQLALRLGEIADEWTAELVLPPAGDGIDVLAVDEHVERPTQRECAHAALRRRRCCGVSVAVVRVIVVVSRWAIEVLKLLPVRPVSVAVN